MTMSDTAEYWWDVKKRVSRTPAFTHIKGYNCGHFHVHETKNIKHVDCHACIKMIKSNPELSSKLDQLLKQEEDHKFRFGKCECGSPMRKRKNKATNQVFLGCTEYPKCKKTKSKQ